MNFEQFDAENWVQRLARALSKQANRHESSLRKYYGLEPGTPMLFGGPQGAPHTFSPEGVRDHFNPPAPHWNWIAGETKNKASSDFASNSVRGVLLSHPMLVAVAGSEVRQGEFWLRGLESGRQTSLVHLIAGLMARASELSTDRFQMAARELSALLAPIGDTDPAGAPDSPDMAYHAVLFCGLTLKETIDISGGIVIVPFDLIKQFVDESLANKLAPAGTEPHGLNSYAALVRPFRWTPSFGLSGDLEVAGSNLAEPFFHDARLFIDLLSVAHTAPLVRLADLSNCIHRSASRLLGLEHQRIEFFRDRTAQSFDPSAECPALARQPLAEATEAFERRKSSEHQAMAPIITRLAGALTRGGQFASDDKILDVAIALEQMYQLPGGEITHKMRTRVAWYLGQDTQSRIKHMKDTKEFYAERSRVVHHGKRKPTAESREKAFTKGFDIAKVTLFKRLRHGPPENWDELVVAGPRQ